MRQFLSLFVLLAFLLNNLSPAFAASCNGAEMLKNGSYPDWRKPDCVLELACACLDTYDKCADSFNSAKQGSALLYATCSKDRKQRDVCIKASAALSVAWKGVYTIGGSTRSSWDKDGNLQSRPYTQADWENDLKRGYAACGKEYSPKKPSDDSSEEEYGQEHTLNDLVVVSMQRNLSYPGTGKTTTETNKLDEVWSAYIEDLFERYEEREVKYKDLSGLIQTWVNRTKDTHPGDPNYISINNLRLLFSKYAGIAKNKKDLLKYVSSQYPARVQYAAAGACSQFSKYRYTKDNEKQPTHFGNFDFDQNERKALAKVLTEEFVRASQEPDANLSDIKYTYHHKMKRLYTYDPQDVKEYVAVPTTKGSILLSSAALGSLQSVGGNTFTVVLENGPFQFNVAPKVAETLNNLKNLDITKGMALSRAIPAGSSVAAVGMPIALPFVGAGFILWDINRGMQPIYEKRQVDGLSKQLDDDLTKIYQPKATSIEDSISLVTSVAWSSAFAKYGSAEATAKNTATCEPKRPERDCDEMDIAEVRNYFTSPDAPTPAGGLNPYLRGLFRNSFTKRTPIKDLLPHFSPNDVVGKAFQFIADNCDSYTNSQGNIINGANAFTKPRKKGSNSIVPEIEVGVDIRNTPLTEVLSDDIINKLCRGNAYLNETIDLGNGRRIRNTEHERNGNHFHYEEEDPSDKSLCNHSIFFMGESFIDKMRDICAARP